MVRRTSSETFASFAKFSTSESVSFGLLSTAADTSLFGSRIRMERSDLEPLIAAFMRLGHPEQCQLLRDALRVGLLLGAFGLRTGGFGIDQRLIAGIASRQRFHAATAEEITQSLGNVRSPEKPGHRFAGNRGECRFSSTAHIGVTVFGQQREQTDLLERAWRERAAGGEQANILGDFSTLEEIQQWAAKTEIHQGVRKFCTLAGVMRVLMTSPGAPSALPARPFRV